MCHGQPPRKSDTKRSVSEWKNFAFLPPETAGSLWAVRDSAMACAAVETAHPLGACAVTHRPFAPVASQVCEMADEGLGLREIERDRQSRSVSPELDRGGCGFLNDRLGTHLLAPTRGQRTSPSAYLAAVAISTTLSKAGESSFSGVASRAFGARIETGALNPTRPPCDSKPCPPLPSPSLQ